MQYGGAYLWLLVVLGLLIPIGCSSRLDRLEDDAEQLVVRHQRQALGSEAANDPNVALTRPGDGPAADVYNGTPETTNPTAEQLPAEPAEGDRTGQVPDQEQADGLKIIPRVLDHSGDQPSTVLNLSDILAYAITNSPQYRSEKESLYLAALRLIMERHEWGPRFFETASAVVDGTPENGDYDTSLSLVNELSVTQRLPYGGRVSASALVDYVTYLQNRSSAPASRADDSQGASVGGSLSLPFLRGAGRVAREPLIQAERDLIYAVRDFERFRRQFLVDLSIRYFELLRRQRQIQNQQRQLDNLEELAARFRALTEAGRKPGFEAEQTQQQVLFGRSSLLSLREAYASALDSFKIRLGLPTTRPLVIEPSRVVVPEVAIKPTRAVTTALDLRLDLQTTHDRIEDARRQVRVAKNDLLPNLDLEADVNLPTAEDDSFGGVDLDPAQGDYSVGLFFDTELDKRIERADYRATLIDWERARRDFRLARDRVAQAVRSAIRQIKQARFTLSLQEKNVELAKRRTQGVALRRRELDARDSIEAQEDLLQARNQRDQALSNLRQNILQFLLSTGQMRVDGGGHWQPPAKLVPVMAEGKQAKDVAPAEVPSTDEQTPSQPKPTDDAGQ